MVRASIYLLTRIGYDVHVPKQQDCCGALHSHEGDSKKALQFATRNIETFNKIQNSTNLVSLVNGCSSQLKEYSKLDTNESFKSEVKDIVEFLSEAHWPSDIKFNPSTQSVALQIPCSLQNILRAEDKLITLLQRIPGISLPQTAIYNRCCGAAGSYFLNFPKISERLKTLALDSLTKLNPEIIISSNIGCALQLKSGLRTQNQNVDVIHPILFLEQHLMKK